MKICSSCKIEQNVTEFNKNSSKCDGLQHVCKQCKRIRGQSSYIKNKELFKQKNNDRRKKFKNYLEVVKSELKCVQCDEDHIATLDFHHIDRELKSFEVSKFVGSMICNDKNILLLHEEIAKCDVLCANCHRIHHYNEYRNVG